MKKLSIRDIGGGDNGFCFHIPLTADEVDQLEELLEEGGLSVAELVRQRQLAVYLPIAVENPYPPVRLRDEDDEDDDELAHRVKPVAKRVPKPKPQRRGRS